MFMKDLRWDIKEFVPNEICTCNFIYYCLYIYIYKMYLRKSISKRIY